METCLVTGCAGFIGSHLTEELLRRGNKVIGIDNMNDYYDPKLKEKNMSGFISNKKFEFHKDTILNQKLVAEIMQKVDIIYHEAAMAGVRNSIRNPVDYFNNNVLGTSILLDFSRKNNVRKFVFASSSSIYGEVKKENLPLREDMKPNPISPYALSKLQCEMLCEKFSEIYGLKTISLRYFTVFGPRQRPDEAFSKFISKMINGQTIEIYGDGEQTRDFTYVDDVVSGTLLAAEHGSGVYNIGKGSSITVNEMVKKISEVSGTKPKIKYVGKQMGDVSHTLADITKAKKDLGYRVTIDMVSGIRKHFEYFYGK